MILKGEYNIYVISRHELMSSSWLVFSPHFCDEKILFTLFAQIQSLSSSWLVYSQQSWDDEFFNFISTHTIIILILIGIFATFLWWRNIFYSICSNTIIDWSILNTTAKNIYYLTYLHNTNTRYHLACCIHNTSLI